MRYDEIVREEAPYISQDWIVYVGQKFKGEVDYRQVYRCRAKMDDEHAAVLGYAQFDWERKGMNRDRNDQNLYWLLVLETSTSTTERKAYALEKGAIPL